MPTRHGAEFIPSAKTLQGSDVLDVADRRIPRHRNRAQRDRIAAPGCPHPGCGLCSRIVERSKTVPLKNHCSSTLPTGAQSRRAALHTGGALLAGMSALALRSQQSAAAQTTPTAEGGGGPLLVQSFSHGSLFPTQGDAGGAPYTLILWDAADQGFFFVDWT